MTREELRDYVEKQRSLNMIPYHVYSTLIDGIDTLEQEPVIDKVKQAREEIQKLVDMCGSDTVADLNMKSGLGLALEKIDKLIESEG